MKLRCHFRMGILMASASLATAWVAPLTYVRADGEVDAPARIMQSKLMDELQTQFPGDIRKLEQKGVLSPEILAQAQVYRAFIQTTGESFLLLQIPGLRQPDFLVFSDNTNLYTHSYYSREYGPDYDYCEDEKCGGHKASEFVGVPALTEAGDHWGWASYLKPELAGREMKLHDGKVLRLHTGYDFLWGNVGPEIHDLSKPNLIGDALFEAFHGDINRANAIVGAPIFSRLEPTPNFCERLLIRWGLKQ